jgi:hypothetical protein
MMVNTIEVFMSGSSVFASFEVVMISETLETFCLAFETLPVPPVEKYGQPKKNPGTRAGVF